MSAISVIALKFPFARNYAACDACNEGMSFHTEEAVNEARIPSISPRWSVEADCDETRRLVQRWFRNENAPPLSSDKRCSG